VFGGADFIILFLPSHLIAAGVEKGFLNWEIQKSAFVCNSGGGEHRGAGAAAAYVIKQGNITESCGGGKNV